MQRTRYGLTRVRHVLTNLADYGLLKRKLNVPVTVTLLRSGLINVTQQDQQLAKFLNADPRPSLLNFAAELIRECLSSDPPVVSQSQFGHTLTQLSQLGKANDE